MRSLSAETIRARITPHHHDSGKAILARRLRWSILLFALAAAVHAQSVPVQTASPLYTPFSIPTINGTLHYSVSASEYEQFGYDGGSGTDTSGSISANFGFVAPSVLRPFSIVYSGGYSLNSLGQTSQFFQNLSLSQGFNTARWKFNVSDSVSYLPETASTGLSGIPGVGDVGVSTGSDSTQQVLTPNSSRIGNSVDGSVSRSFTGKTSLSGTASYSIQRFLNDADAIETDSLGAGGSLVHHIDARSTVSGSYHYNQFTYLNDPGAFSSQGATFNYTRKATRHLDLSLGAGPEFVGGSSGRNPTYTYSADVRATYSGGVASAASLTASYIRSANSGSGTNFGATTDTYSLTGSRRVTRSLQPSAQVSYTRTVGLATVGSPELDSHTFVASVQANRAISRVLSVFASYSVQHQTYSGNFQGINPLTGLIQTLAFGVTYSPISISVGRH